MPLPPVADCPLCQAQELTPWYRQDDLCWIADCEVCATPMVVWRHHGIDPTDDERTTMLGQLAEVADGAIGAHWFDGDMRSIPDHFHCHARPQGGFFGPGGPRPRTTPRRDGR